MAVELFDNATSAGTSASTTAPVSASDLQLPVSAPASERLQQPGGQFRIVVIDPTTGNVELMLVDGNSAWSANWSVVRGIEDSTPSAFPQGSIVRHILTAGALANLMAQGGVINPPPIGSEVEQPTVDTNQLYKIILFSNGTVTGIPAGANPPAQPTGLAVTTLHLSFLVLGWTAVSGADHYNVFRDGSFLASTRSPTYTDSVITIGSTYHYTVQAVDQYTQTGPQSASVSANIDASLDQPPIVVVGIYPNPVPAGSTAIVRISAYSLDALALSETLNVDVGQLTPTFDPTTWLLTV
jgi:hypothetical protein